MMLTWGQQLESITDAAVDTAAFGEPVTLADTTQIIALFNPGLTPGWGFGQSIPEALDALPQPSIDLQDAVYQAQAALLQPGLTITHNAIAYRIAEPAEPDGHGLTRLALMPAHDTSAPTATSGDPRWR